MVWDIDEQEQLRGTRKGNVDTSTLGRTSFGQKRACYFCYSQAYITTFTMMIGMLDQ